VYVKNPSRIFQVDMLKVQDVLNIKDPPVGIDIPAMDWSTLASPRKPFALNSTIIDGGIVSEEGSAPFASAADTPDRSKMIPALSPFMRYFASEGTVTVTGNGASLGGKSRRGLKKRSGALPSSPSTISTQSPAITPLGHQEKPLGAPGEEVSTVERVLDEK